MSGRPYLLREINWAAVQHSDYRVAVLPWGATEAHNYHLPYGTDNYEAEAVAAGAAERAWRAGARVIVLPGIPFGVNTGQLDIALTINLNPSSQLLVLRDAVESLERHGIHRVVIVNGHGGNDFKWMIRELQATHRALIAQVNWWQIEQPGAYFSAAGDHAGELETAVMMHLTPELVLPLDQAGPGAALVPAIRAFRECWAWTPRRWTQVTQDTGVGDPRPASAAAGRRYFDAVVEKLGDFLVDFEGIADGEFYTSEPV